MHVASTLRTFSFILILFVAIPQISGCATIIRGSDQDVRVTSDPPNARVMVNGQDRGKTPTTLNLGTSRNYQIEFSKDGYTSETLNVTKDFTVGWPIFGNVFSWGIIGIVVDVANGSAYKLTPDQLEAALETTSADVRMPSDSDIHIALFSSEEVSDTIELTQATKVEFSINK